MKLEEFAEFVKEQVIKKYGKLSERNVIEWLDNETFLSNDEIMMVLNAIGEMEK